MSWKDAAKKLLQESGMEVGEDQRGLVVTPPEGPSLLVVVRRLHMSLDRKVEVMGVFEAAQPPAEAKSALLAMLSSSFEVELKGIFSRKYVWRGWSELGRLEPLVGPLPRSSGLIERLRKDARLIEGLRRAAPNLVEVFPEILPPSFMEAYLLNPGGQLSTYVAELIREYVEKPQRLAWCYRAQLLYGMPDMPRRVVKNCSLASSFGRVLKEVTPWLLQYTSSYPRGVESST